MTPSPRDPTVAPGTLFHETGSDTASIAERLRQGESVRVLSLWQPWASLVAARVKRFETRSWSTRYRGLIAIHAARTKLGLQRVDDDLQPVLSLFSGHLPAELPFGQVVALARLVEVHATGPEMGWPPSWVHALDQDERAAGNFAPGRYGFELELVGELLSPIPFRGAQGLRPAPRELELALASNLRPHPSPRTLR